MKKTINSQADDNINVLFTLTGHPDRATEGITMSTARLAKSLSQHPNMKCCFVNADLTAPLRGRIEADSSLPCLSIKLPTNSGQANVLWRMMVWLPKFIIVILRLYVFCRRHRIHYIVTYLHARHLYFYWLSKISSVRYISILRGSETFYFDQLPPPIQKDLRRLARGSTELLAVSDSLARKGAEIFNNGHPIGAIHNGVNLHQTQENENSATTKTTTALITGSLPAQYMVSVGRLHPVKGFDVALQSFKEISRHYPELYYVIIGEGEERHNLQQQISDLGLDDRVILYGQQPADHIPVLLKGATVCLVPSHSEGLSNIVLEAAFMGTAVIASKVGGIPEIIPDDSHGLLVHPGDAAALAAAIRKSLDNPALKRQRAQRLKKRVRKEFSLQSMQQNYLELFQKLKAATE
ncbi:MAG: hypothetical protein CMF31_06325 [Kordiimonas sp.]|nr:hypothetical protein [Kordiimonas sp.]|tara:strand:- start:631 stop:1857 length:1227 start_codon:yes stop_codon:yes gene_type:complete